MIDLNLVNTQPFMVEIVMSVNFLMKGNSEPICEGDDRW
jgi:hypothetical protein